MNVVLIVCDQLSAAALPCYGNTVVKAPAIARLAEEGTVCRSAYCAFPLCSPSRAAMLTGRLPSRMGICDNGCELAAGVPTLAHFLRAMGYYTCLAGKMHFLGPDQLHGFEDRLVPELHPTDFSWTSNWDKDGPKLPHERVSRTRKASVRNVANCGTADWTMQMEHDEEVLFQTLRKLHDLARGHERRPFFLTVSFVQPHDPFVAKPEYWELYRDGDIDMPRTPLPPPERRDGHTRMICERLHADEHPLSAREVRAARRAYYAMISDIDAKIGAVLDALNRLYGDDTLVVLTSDHGEMLGEHGLWAKSFFFEDSARVPLILRSPRERWVREVTQNVSLLDLLPTIVEAAGGAQLLRDFGGALDGVSLLPLLRGGAGDGARPVFCEHCDGRTDGPRLMVRSGACKYVMSLCYEPQMYDLSRDPQELDNLAGRPEYAAEEDRLRALLAEKYGLGARGLRPMYEACLARQKANRLITEALGRGRPESWKQGCTDSPADRRFVVTGDIFPDVDLASFVNAELIGE